MTLHTYTLISQMVDFSIPKRFAVYSKLQYWQADTKILHMVKVCVPLCVPLLQRVS